MNVRFRRREDTAGREWLRQSLGGIPGQLRDWLHDQEESLFLEEGGTTEHGGVLGPCLSELCSERCAARY